MSLGFTVIFFPGTCIGTFCVDRSFTSDSPDGAALGAAPGLHFLWACFPHRPRPPSSWLGENDDEVQVALSLHSLQVF